MTTIQALGNHDIAGSLKYPTTYKIRACPRCYGVLDWCKKGQKVVTCTNCNTTIYVQNYAGPLDYIRQKIQAHPFSRETVILALYAVVQVLDYRLHLRKLLLMLFIRGLSHL